jgi:hypothetical protein
MKALNVGLCPYKLPLQLWQNQEVFMTFVRPLTYCTVDVTVLLSVLHASRVVGSGEIVFHLVNLDV